MEPLPWPANLPRVHRAVAGRLGPRVALRHRQDGLYHDVSWAEYRRRADDAAAGFIALGMQPGERIALLSENRFQWLVADHAILSAGAIGVPLHASLTPEQVARQVAHGGCRGIVLGGREQAEKILAVRDSLPTLEFVVAFDPLPRRDAKGCGPASVRKASRLPSAAAEAAAVPGTAETAAERDDWLTWERLKRRGRVLGEAGRNEIRRREAALGEDDVATILYTSGTTGRPKGVMLTHGNLLSNAEATRQVSGIGPDDVLLSWLPYSHIYARTVDHYLTTLAGATVALAESFETLIANLAETRPTWMTAVPRFFEKVWAAVEHLPSDERSDRLRHLFGPRLRQLSSGGAPLPKHLCEAFFEAGLPLLEGYGLTESSPVIAFNRPHAWRAGTVGQAVPGVEVRIAEDGEILTRGPHVMRGYWQDPEATAETIADGWLHTGDLGSLDADGFLTVSGRKKDLIVLSTGKNVVPAEIERLLTADELVDQAVVYGDGRPFLSALIVPNGDRLREQAEALGCGIETRGDIIETPELSAWFRERLEGIMQAVSRPERVREFLLLSRPFEIAEGELTPTLKVRRQHVIEEFADELARLYDESRKPSDSERGA